MASPSSASKPPRKRRRLSESSSSGVSSPSHQRGVRITLDQPLVSGVKRYLPPTPLLLGGPPPPPPLAPAPPVPPPVNSGESSSDPEPEPITTTTTTTTLSDEVELAPRPSFSESLANHICEFHARQSSRANEKQRAEQRRLLGVGSGSGMGMPGAAAGGGGSGAGGVGVGLIRPLRYLEGSLMEMDKLRTICDQFGMNFGLQTMPVPGIGTGTGPRPTMATNEERSAATDDGGGGGADPSAAVAVTAVSSLPPSIPVPLPVPYCSEEEIRDRKRRAALSVVSLLRSGLRELRKRVCVSRVTARSLCEIQRGGWNVRGDRSRRSFVDVACTSGVGVQVVVSMKEIDESNVKPPGVVSLPPTPGQVKRKMARLDFVCGPRVTYGRGEVLASRIVEVCRMRALKKNFLSSRRMEIVDVLCMAQRSVFAQDVFRRFRNAVVRPASGAAVSGIHVVSMSDSAVRFLLEASERGARYGSVEVKLARLKARPSFSGPFWDIHVSQTVVRESESISFLFGYLIANMLKEAMLRTYDWEKRNRRNILESFKSPSSKAAVSGASALAFQGVIPHSNSGLVEGMPSEVTVAAPPRHFEAVVGFVKAVWHFVSGKGVTVRLPFGD